MVFVRPGKLRNRFWDMLEFTNQKFSLGSLYQFGCEFDKMLNFQENFIEIILIFLSKIFIQPFLSSDRFLKRCREFFIFRLIDYLTLKICVTIDPYNSATHNSSRVLDRLKMPLFWEMKDIGKTSSNFLQAFSH